MIILEAIRPVRGPCFHSEHVRFIIYIVQQSNHIHFCFNSLFTKKYFGYLAKCQLESAVSQYPKRPTKSSVHNHKPKWKISTTKKNNCQDNEVDIDNYSITSMNHRWLSSRIKHIAQCVGIQSLISHRHDILHTYAIFGSKRWQRH